MDLSFIKAGPGRAMVGIKFCVRGNRVALCIKTADVKFFAGKVGQGEWSSPPWGDHYGSFSDFIYMQGNVVETNPPAMTTALVRECPLAIFVSNIQDGLQNRSVCK